MIWFFRGFVMGKILLLFTLDSYIKIELELALLVFVEKKKLEDLEKNSWNKGDN